MLVVLNYHSVTDNRDLPLSIKVKEFERQISYLKKKGYLGLSLEEAIKYDTNSIDRKIVALTFDDGYKDNYENVFPILKKYGFSATVFLISDYIGSKKTFPWHKRRNISLSLNWKEIKEMMEGGIVFGSHTLTHPFLTKISSKEAWREIKESKDYLEEKLGTKIQSFAYPYGDFNSKIKEMVKKAGYEIAVGLRCPKEIKEDRFSISRIGVSSIDSFLVFKFKLSGIYRLMRQKRLDRFLSRNWIYNFRRSSE